MRSYPLALAFLIVLAAAPDAAARGLAGAEAARAAACPGGGAAALQCLVNQTRRSHGLAPLRASARLNRSARLRAEAIRRCGDFSHTACGQSFTVVFRRAGYLRGNAAVGENLAWGAPASAERAIALWLTSPGHRANLLSRRWREVGVASLRADRLFGASGVSIWVAQFGYRR